MNAAIASAKYVVAAYLFYWAVDWIQFRYVDWYIARANRGIFAKPVRTNIAVAFGVTQFGGRRLPAKSATGLYSTTKLETSQGTLFAPCNVV